jgi:hypothetical protein
MINYSKYLKDISNNIYKDIKYMIAIINEAKSLG